MDGKSLQDRAAARAEELPGAELTHPFGPDWDVWKVRGKVFMLQTALADEALVTLKAEPEDSRALREAYADITTGYHMNKKHWITVHPNGALDEQLLEDLVTDSYLLVVANLPKHARPVDPATFGRRD